MAKTYQDLIRLDFEVASKGTKNLRKLAYDLERIEKVLRSLKDIGNVTTFKELEKAAKEARELRKQLRRVKETADDIEKSSKGLTVFGQNIGTLVGKITLFATLTGIIVKTIRYFTELAQAVGELESRMARVSTVTRPTTQNLHDSLFAIRTEALRMSREVSESFNEITVSAYAAGSAGLSFKAQIASIRPITNLTVATLGDLEQTAKLVTGVYNVFGKETAKLTSEKEALNDISDIIADTYSREQIELSELNQALSLSSSAWALFNDNIEGFRDITATIGFLSSNLLKSSKAGTALLNSLIQIAKNSDTLKEKFVVSLDPTKPLVFKDLIHQIANNFKDGTISAEQFRDIIDVFGIRGARAIALIIQNYERYQKAVGRSIEDTKDMAAVLAILQSRNISSSFDRMTNTLGESLVLLNDIVGVTRFLRTVFDGISGAVGSVNDGLTETARNSVKRAGERQIEKDRQKIEDYKREIEAIEQKKADIRNRISTNETMLPTFSSSGRIAKMIQEYTSAYKKQLVVLDEDIIKKKELIRITEKLVKTQLAGGTVKNEGDGFLGFKLKEVDELPAAIQKAVFAAETFGKIKERERTVNGDILGVQEKINSLLTRINIKIERNNTELISSEKIDKLKLLHMDKSLKLKDDELKQLIQEVGLKGKAVASDKESAALIKLISELTEKRKDREKEIKDSIEQSAIAVRNNFELEKARIHKKTKEVVLTEELNQTLSRLESKHGIILKLSELQSMSASEILSKHQNNKKALQLLIALSKTKYEQELENERELQKLQERRQKKETDDLKLKHKIALKLLKAGGGSQTEEASAKLNYLKEEKSLIEKQLQTARSRNEITDSYEDKLIQINQKLKEQQATIEAIGQQQDVKELMSQFKNYHESMVNQVDDANSKYEVTLSILRQVTQLAQTRRDYQVILNKLQEEGISIQSITLAQWRNQIEHAHELAKIVNDEIKDSLFDSLMNAKKLNEAFEDLGAAVGKIILRRQFDNVMDDILSTFNVGKATVSSQIKKGGDSLVKTLGTQLPPIFDAGAQSIKQGIKEGFQESGASVTGQSGVSVPDIVGKSGASDVMVSDRQKKQAEKERFGFFKDAWNVVKGTAGATKDVVTYPFRADPAKDVGNGLKAVGSFSKKTWDRFAEGATTENIFGGALAGYGLAQSRNRDSTGQIGAAVGGAIGNAILPGVGGVVGGLLGSFLGGEKEKPKEPEKIDLAFRLDLSNSILKDINRNLTAIREDTNVFSLQSSFYFSSAQSQGPSSIVFNGDMVFSNPSSSERSFTAQDVGEAIAQQLSYEGARGTQ